MLQDRPDLRAPLLHLEHTRDPRMHIHAQARASLQVVATLKPFPASWEQTFFGQAKVKFGECVCVADFARFW